MQNIIKGSIVRLKDRGESHVVLDWENDRLRLARLIHVSNPREWVREDHSTFESVFALKRGDRILHISNLEGIKLVVLYVGLDYAMALEALVVPRSAVVHVESDQL